MKRSLLFIFLMGILFNASAQIRYSTAKYNKADVPAILVEYPFTEDIVKDGLKDFFEKKGYKSKGAKSGFMLFAGVSENAIADIPLDIYISVERKSRADKDKAIVTVLLSKGFENFLSSETNSDVINNAKDYFDKVKEELVEYDLELQIQEQENQTNKATKKYNNLVEDSVKLQTRKRELELVITENSNAQAAQKLELEKQKQFLENLKRKRRGSKTQPLNNQPAKND